MRFRLINLIPVLFFVCCFCSNLGAQPHSESLYFGATDIGNPVIGFRDDKGKTSSSKSASKSASVLSGLGMNRTAQSFRKESVTVDSATRNTHMHQQAGARKWAIQNPNYVLVVRK